MSESRITAAQQLRDVAAQQEQKLEAINTFKPNSNEYGATNPEVLNANEGTAIDKQQRKILQSINFYNENNQYKSPE